MGDVTDGIDNDTLDKAYVYNEIFVKLADETKRRSYCLAQLDDERIFARPNKGGEFTAERIYDDFTDYYKDDGKIAGKVLRVYTYYAPTSKCVKHWESLQQKYDIKIDIRAVSPYSQGETAVEKMLHENRMIQLRAFKPKDWKVLSDMIKRAETIPGDLPDVDPPSQERLAADAAAEIRFAKLRPTE